MRNAPSQEAMYDVSPPPVQSLHPGDGKFPISNVDPKHSIRLVGAPQASEVKKEKKGGGLEFWERISGKDRDKERDKEVEHDREREPRVKDRERGGDRERERDKDRFRDKERDRRDEEGQLTRMIGSYMRTLPAIALKRHYQVSLPRRHQKIGTLLWTFANALLPMKRPLRRPYEL